MLQREPSGLLPAPCFETKAVCAPAGDRTILNFERRDARPLNTFLILNATNSGMWLST
jgi:hypothetical protein